MTETQIRVGSSIETLQSIKINDDDGIYISSKDWEGLIIVRVKNTETTLPNPHYFTGKSRTFSIQFRNGKWKNNWPAEDIVFGAVFDNPIDPPFGTSIAFEIARLIDPSLEADLYSSKPWLLSPLVCAFNDLAVFEGEDNRAVKIDKMYIIENNSLLFKGETLTSSQRRSRLKSKAELAQCAFRSDFIYSGDFFGPVLDLVNMKLNLGIQFHIEDYINGQPLRFLAKSKSTETVFFVIEFQ